MAFAFALLAAIGATSDASETELARYRRLHAEWLRLHEDGTQPAHLIIDPREGAMWIECRGKVHEGYTVELPTGFRWHAFHITQSGIVERSFPVRLTAPRPNVDDEAKEEQLWVTARADQESCRISFSATRAGVAFHAGFGSRTGDVTFHLPAAAPRAAKFTSFVAPQSPRIVKPREFVQKRGFAVRVKRRTTGPNVE